MPAPQIFISYRRDDSAGYARAVYDALSQRFGAERVFIDVDDIAAGQPFAEVLRRAVGSSTVLLVLIGPRWRGERPGQRARLDDIDDFVRLEVAAALAGGARVIPLLIDGTPMPGAAQLPADLQALTGRNALAIGHAHFGTDLARLVAALGAAVPAPPRPPGLPLGLGRWPVAAGLIVLGIAASGAWYVAAPRTAPGLPAASAPTATVRPAINGIWEARVRYDWPNADYAEGFTFGGAGDSLHGTASFLRVPRGVLEGSVAADGLGFVTRTAEMAGGAELVHRYRARLVGDELRFVMQTEGGSSAHTPVEFVARRVPGAPR